MVSSEDAEQDNKRNTQAEIIIESQKVFGSFFLSMNLLKTQLIGD